MEAHGQKVIALVDRFRGLGGETKNEAAAMRRVYDSLLRQVEADATSHLELASVLQQQLARPTVECCFPRKVQNKWVSEISLAAQLRVYWGEAKDEWKLFLGKFSFSSKGALVKGDYYC